MTNQKRPERPTLKPGQKRHSRIDPRPKPMFNECATPAFLRKGSDRPLVIATASCNRTQSGFFDLFEPLLIRNISRKFGPRSAPTKSLKLIKIGRYF